MEINTFIKSKAESSCSLKEGCYSFVKENYIQFYIQEDKKPILHLFEIGKVDYKNSFINIIKAIKNGDWIFTMETNKINESICYVGGFYNNEHYTFGEIEKNFDEFMKFIFTKLEFAFIK
jgi:hypothetical protein